MVLRLRCRRRLTPSGGLGCAVPATLLGRLPCGVGGRLLNRRSARKTEFVGGLVLSSTASADDHVSETPGRKPALPNGGASERSIAGLSPLWNKNPQNNRSQPLA